MGASTPNFQRRLAECSLSEANGNVTLDNLYHDHQRAIMSRRKKIKRLRLKRRTQEIVRNAAQPQIGVRTLSKKNGPSV